MTPPTQTPPLDLDKLVDGGFPGPMEAAGVKVEGCEP